MLQTPMDVRVGGGAEAAWTMRAGRRHVVLLLVVAVPLLFGALGLSFLDPDEGLYADISQRMVADRDWVLPHFNGLPYLEKPPLYFWISAVALGVLGHGETAVRLGSALAALGTVLLAWRIGVRLYGADAGLRAGIALATTAGFALYVRKASTDMVFVFCLTLALYGFLRDAATPARGRWRFALFYVGAAVSVLTKGLIGVVFPVAIVAVTLLRVRQLALRDLNVGRGLAIFTAIAVPWHVLVAWREPGLLWFYVVDNQILRFLNLRGFFEDDIPVTAPALLGLTFIWYFPWSVFVFARPGVPATTKAAAWRPLLVIWAVVVMVFFMASRSKLEYYGIPAMPALAVLAGAGWTSGRDIGRWLIAGVTGCVVVGAALVWVGARLTPDQALNGLAELNVYYRILREQGVGFPFESVEPFRVLVTGLGLTLVVGWAAAGLAWWRGQRGVAFAAVTVVGIVLTVLIVRLLYLVEPHHSAEAVAHAVSARAGAGDVIAHEGPLEYSAALPFYAGRRVVVINGARGDLDIASHRPEARGWFLEGPDLAARWAAGPRIFLVTQRPRERSVVAVLPAESVHLLGHFGSRWLYSNREN